MNISDKFGNNKQLYTKQHSQSFTYKLKHYFKRLWLALMGVTIYYNSNWIGNCDDKIHGRDVA